MICLRRKSVGFDIHLRYTIIPVRSKCWIANDDGFLTRAIQFGRNFEGDGSCGYSDPGESNHLAHATARVLRSLSAREVARDGDEWIALIEKEMTVAALAAVADKKKPTFAEMNRVADQLARRGAAISLADARTE